MNFSSRVLVPFLVAIVFFAGSAAEAGNPSRAELRNALHAHLPTFTRLNNFSVEASQNLGNEVDPVWGVRFNATVVTVEDLYVRSSSQNNVVFVSLLTKKNAVIKIFGQIRSHLYQGGWRHDFNIDGDPLSKIGLPLTRLSQGSRLIVRGSKEEVEYYANLQKEAQIKNELEEKRRAEERQKQIESEIYTSAQPYFAKGSSALQESVKAKAEKFDEAIAYFSKAIEMDKKHINAYMGRGESYLYTGQSDKAISDFAKVDELSSNNVTKSWANWKIGSVYEKKDDFKLADQFYNKAIDLGPGKRADVYGYIARFYATCKNKAYRNGQKAIKYATEACLNTEWKNAWYIDKLAAGYAEAGDFDSAVRMQQKAIAIVEAADKEDFQKRLSMYMNKQTQ